jgi:hypothetical protein
MKTIIRKVRIEGKSVWQWRIMQGRKVLSGGLCATMQDARSDAAKALPATPACAACGGKGYLILASIHYGATVERCDACERFGSDIHAALGLFSKPDCKYELHSILIKSK